jgi:hypothetical protein
MGPYEQIIHLLNLLAPAWFLALFVALLGRLLVRWGLPRAVWRLPVQVGVNGVLGSLVVVTGLMFFGVDGKMSMYAALVVSCATVQWLMCRAWRR